MIIEYKYVDIAFIMLSLIDSIRKNRYKLISFERNNDKWILTWEVERLEKSLIIMHKDVLSCERQICETLHIREDAVSNSSFRHVYVLR